MPLTLVEIHLYLLCFCRKAEHSGTGHIATVHAGNLAPAEPRKAWGFRTRLRGLLERPSLALVSMEAAFGAYRSRRGRSLQGLGSPYQSVPSVSEARVSPARFSYYHL